MKVLDMDSKFHPHGSYEGTIDGRLLISTHGGAWNVEMYQKAARTALPLIRELNATGYWGTLIVLDTTMLNHPDVFKVGRNWVLSPEVSNMVGVAWVISPRLEGYAFLIHLYRELYEGLVQSAIFDTLEEARDWMHRKIDDRVKSHEGKT